MKVQMTESGTWRRTLEIEVPPEDVEERLKDAYKSYGKSLNLPGFRKGKVPVSIVKARFGGLILEEVLQTVQEETYREASDAEGLHPVAQAVIEERDYTEDQGLRFKATVEVKPNPTIEDYKGLQVTRPVFKIEDEHVADHLQSLREQNATEQAVDRPLELGDVLVADLQELDETGLPIIGTKQENRSFWVGAPRSANHDLDNQLVGIAVGEDRRIRLTQPQDLPDPEQAGKEIHFQVNAKEIRERKLPELDDEFAKDLGDHESLEALKTHIREDMRAQADSASRRRLQENFMDGLIRQNDFELPDSMVDNYLNNVVEAYKQEHADHDHDIDEDAIRNENRDAAVRSVRRFLILERIAEQEGIKVTEEDIDAHLGDQAKRYNIEASRLRQIYSRSEQLSRMESDLLDEKVFDFLIAHATVEDVEEVSEET